MTPRARSALVAPLLALLLGCAGCGGSADPVAAPATSPTSPPTSPGPTGQPVAAVHRSASFQTPSHNITCQATTSPRMVECAVDYRHWSVPGGERRWCGPMDLQGLSLTRGQEPRFLCATDVLAPSPDEVLGYGRIFRFAGFTCSSRRSGVTCSDGVGGHFLVARDTYRTD